MLLLHQSGSVRIGEVVRYQVKYTPAVDRILPSPAQLHLKIKNTSAIALRAAFVHGPYTLYAAAYPSNYRPNEKFENPRRDGIPEFEPNLKAGGSFQTQLSVPETVRESAGTAHSRNHEGPEPESVTWIIEVASQVIFSNSAAVHYEILIGRDEKSLSMGFGPIIGGSNGTPGQVTDHQQSQGAKDGHHNAQQKGVYSRAITLKVDDTASLWNTPALPEWDDAVGAANSSTQNADTPVAKAQEGSHDDDNRKEHRQKRQKKVHLVILTHGLHSNLGADMLYLKESIDAAAKQARLDARNRRRTARYERKKNMESELTSEGHDTNLDESQAERNLEDDNEEDEEETDEDEEEVIVRGFSGNAVRTERGIKYLGKRLAKYVLAMTYPDQPFLPVTKTVTQSLATVIAGESPKDRQSGTPSHSHSSIIKEPYRRKKQAYKITSISFIAHSLGGLIQTYAVAYIQKHSPEFFDLIKPINFIALATPFLGLNHENPLYVKFALDFGLVGRTGQDLGLTWRAPTIARSGWGAIVGGIGESASRRVEGEKDPGAKPLLRILPTGPAHQVLKKFRHRTVYSNVVNDGIVPLRTSCLLFLDWQGLGRVEKARRENGLVGTMAGWGWAELTGANANPGSSRKAPWADGNSSEGELAETGMNTPTRQGDGEIVPQPPATATKDDDTRSLRSFTDRPRSAGSVTDENGLTSPTSPSSTSSTTNNGGAFSSLLSFFKPSSNTKSHNHTPKHTRIYRRSQTINFNDDSSANLKPERLKDTRETTTIDDSPMSAPPTTTFFESAGDLLKPPLPPVNFLLDPSTRPRTIFHDRVYHPEDIPPPPLKQRATGGLLRRSSQSTLSPTSLTPSSHQSSNLSSHDYDDTAHTNPHKDPDQVIDGSAMKVEEKIARAYHRDLSWRKVLVRLEPDAHNNMIVRRMFSNAYGWPVVKHLVDTHFSDQAVAAMRDEDESNRDRAKASNEGVSETGDEIKASERRPRDDEMETHIPRFEDKRLKQHKRTDSEIREASDTVAALPTAGSLASSSSRPGVTRQDSIAWSDRDWADSTYDSDSETGSEYVKSPTDIRGGWNWTEKIAGKGKGRDYGTDDEEQKGTDDVQIADFLAASPAKTGTMGMEEPVVDSAPVNREVNDKGEDEGDTGGIIGAGLKSLGLA
jgi:hypothetical protein